MPIITRSKAFKNLPVPIVAVGKKKVAKKVEVMEKIEKKNEKNGEFLKSKPSWNQWTLEDFEIGKPLGHGSFGAVYLARTRRKKLLVALKMFHIEKMEKHSKMSRLKIWEMFQRETEIHQDLEHPNIIPMLGYFEDDGKIIIVLEYSPGGDLYFELWREPKRYFSDEKAATYIYQITLALEYLHSKNIIHRDIKLENLLIGFFGEIKIADFGLSIKTKIKNELRETYCGTLEYMTPQQIQNQPYTNKVDIWSVGILLYEFLTGESPFLSSPKCNTIENISKAKFVNPELILQIDKKAQDLIKKILNHDPEKRPTLSEIRQHPFILENKVDEELQLPRPRLPKYSYEIPVITLD